MSPKSVFKGVNGARAPQQTSSNDTKKVPPVAPVPGAKEKELLAKGVKVDEKSIGQSNAKRVGEEQFKAALDASEQDALAGGSDLPHLSVMALVKRARMGEANTGDSFHISTASYLLADKINREPSSAGPKLKAWAAAVAGGPLAVVADGSAPDVSYPQFLASIKK